MSLNHSSGVVMCAALSSMFATAFSRLNNEERIVVLQKFHSAIDSATILVPPSVAFTREHITLDDARQQYAEGCVDGVSIRLHAKPDGGFYTLAFESISYEHGFVELTGNEIEGVLTFGSLDDAHKALRRIGIRPARFSLVVL